MIRIERASSLPRRLFYTRNDKAPTDKVDLFLTKHKAELGGMGWSGTGRQGEFPS